MITTAVRRSLLRCAPSSQSARSFAVPTSARFFTSTTSKNSTSDDGGSDPAFAPRRKAGFDAELAGGEASVASMLQSLVDSSQAKKRPLLFMKGTPSQPQCGFSYQVVRVLHAEGAEFDAVNVLEDPEVREGVKAFSEWPTIPQLYIDGEFIGGCDVVTNLHQEGELKTILEEAGCVSE